MASRRGQTDQILSNASETILTFLPAGTSFQCDTNTSQCYRAQWGDKTNATCAQHCSAGGYTCEESAPGKGQCKQSVGGSFKNQTDCAKSCPSNATNSTPYEVRGIWRGFEIQNGFKTGEWEVLIKWN